jgi:hypothetical protein
LTKDIIGSGRMSQPYRVLLSPKMRRLRSRRDLRKCYRWEGVLDTGYIHVVVRFKGRYRDFLVCVRRVFADMTLGGTPYGYQ